LVASYARGLDYHAVILERLLGLAEESGFGRFLPQVDATVLPERAIARRTGLGWIGLNRFLIHPELGGDVCIAELALDHSFSDASSEPLRPLCGDCRACIDACPTGALTVDGVDARRCLSFHTSQNRGVIPRDLRRFVTLVLGCDRCLHACPFGLAARTPETHDDTFLARLIPARTPQEFRSLARAGPLAHPGRTAVVRSACVVAAARQRDDLIPQLAEAMSTDLSPVVRGHAAWALGRFDVPRARQYLAKRSTEEPDPSVQEEIACALGDGE
jgi:epoxyqueuosine reductase